MKSVRRHSRLKGMLLFAHNFIKHPKMLGSVIPSSRFLIEHLVRQIDWKTARVIVEYGPGVGTITGELLSRLGPEGHLVVLETNDDFVKLLRQNPDPRLHVVHGSAADVSAELRRLGLGDADYVISGIPFSTLPKEVRSEVVRATRQALRPGGAFLVYQFSAAVLPYLRKEFRTVRQEFEPLNIPPARLYYSVA